MNCRHALLNNKCESNDAVFVRNSLSTKLPPKKKVLRTVWGTRGDVAQRSMTIQDFKIPRKITATALIGMKRSANGAERSESANNKDSELWFADPSERIRASVIGFAAQANKWAIPSVYAQGPKNGDACDESNKCIDGRALRSPARAIRMGMRAGDCRFHLPRICSQD